MSRYDRPRSYVSWGALFFGLVLGIVGGLFFAWNVAPTEEFDTAPWQLVEEDRWNYMVALMLNYSYDGDLARTFEGLADLRIEGDPIQKVADVACLLARSGYVDSTSGENAIRSMMQFYRLQNRTSCADELISLADVAPTSAVIMASTPTRTPPPTKTPTPQGQIAPTQDSEFLRIVPTVESQSDFRLARLESFCDADISGMIEVYVQNADGSPVSGELVKVAWNEGESVFMTGLKPERGRDYADFEMTLNTGYIIEIPGKSDPSTQQIVALGCVAETGEQSITSYRAVFRPSF